MKAVMSRDNHLDIMTTTHIFSQSSLQAFTVFILAVHMKSVGGICEKNNKRELQREIQTFSQFCRIIQYWLLSGDRVDSYMLGKLEQ